MCTCLQFCGLLTWISVPTLSSACRRCFPNACSHRSSAMGRSCGIWSWPLLVLGGLLRGSSGRGRDIRRDPTTSLRCRCRSLVHTFHSWCCHKKLKTYIDFVKFQNTRDKTFNNFILPFKKKCMEKGINYLYFLLCPSGFSTNEVSL